MSSLEIRQPFHGRFGPGSILLELPSHVVDCSGDLLVALHHWIHRDAVGLHLSEWSSSLFGADIAAKEASLQLGIWPWAFGNPVGYVYPKELHFHRDLCDHPIGVTSLLHLLPLPWWHLNAQHAGQDGRPIRALPDCGLAMAAGLVAQAW